MSEVPVEFRALLGEMRRWKSVTVRRGALDDVLHILEFGRDGRRIIRAAVNDADVLLAIITKTIPAIAADWVAMGMDAYRFSKATLEATDTNPITGRPWEHGDMARIAAMDAGVERGIISETLHFLHATRDGRWLGGDIPYRIDKRRGRPIYESFTTWNGEGLTGVFGDKRARFPRVIHEAFAHPTSVQMVVAAKYGHTDEDTLRLSAVLVGDFIEGFGTAARLLEMRP